MLNAPPQQANTRTKEHTLDDMSNNNCEHNHEKKSRTFEHFLPTKIHFFNPNFLTHIYNSLKNKTLW